MDDKTLQKLANIALISNHVSSLLNRSDIPKNSLHQLIPLRTKMDQEFIQIMINDKSSSETDEYIQKRIEEEKAKSTKKTNKKTSVKRVKESE